MNILFVHEVDWLRKVVYDPHMLAEAISLRKHNVYVLDYESMWGKNGNNQLTRVFDDASLKLVRTPFIKLPIVSRISAAVSQQFNMGKILKKYDIDAIVLYSVPTNGLQTLYWAKKYKIPVFFRSLDILHQLVNITGLKTITKVMERLVYSNIDVGLTITPTLSRYMKSMGAKHTMVLNMPVDTTKFKPYKSNIRNKWGIKNDDRVILFIGTLYNFSGLDMLIKNIHRLGSKLLIVGNGPQFNDLERTIYKYRANGDVIITGFQPYSDMPDYINTSDVCVLPFRNTPATNDIFPGKLVQYLACGKPVVTTPLMGIKEVMPEGTVTYAQGEVSFVHQIVNSYKHPINSTGLDYVKDNHCAFKVAERLEKIIYDW